MGGTTSADLAPLLAVLGLWTVVGLAIYVWYLWSLSQLFPKLGMPSWEGWVPVWNQWRLVERAGLPGWTVLFGLVPGLSVIAVIFIVMAVHRLNVEHGKDAGFTVLGFFIPPLWAMLLARHIAHAMPFAAARPGAGGVPVAPYPPQAARAPEAPPAAQPGQQNPWGFGLTTEGAYERLASEEPPARAAAPLGAPQHQQPFTWPAPMPAPGYAPAAESGSAPGGSAPSSDVEHHATPPVQPMPSAAIQLPAPMRLPSAHDAERESERGALPAAPALPAVESTPAPPAAAEPAPAPPVEPALGPAAQPTIEPEAEPAVAREAEPAVDPAPAPPVEQTPQAPERSIFDLRGWAENGGAAPDPNRDESGEIGEGDEIEDTDDRTVLVPRRARWGLELPDGGMLELPGDDVVIGRKPQAAEGSEVLQINDPMRTLSKTHARLRRTGESWTVEDLGSTNGLAIIDDEGNAIEIDPGEQHEATEQMIIGTLEVKLRRMA